MGTAKNIPIEKDGEEGGEQIVQKPGIAISKDGPSEILI